jgi:hypothetical protein
VKPSWILPSACLDFSELDIVRKISFCLNFPCLDGPNFPCVFGLLLFYLVIMHVSSLLDAKLSDDIEDCNVWCCCLV